MAAADVTGAAPARPLHPAGLRALTRRAALHAFSTSTLLLGARLFGAAAGFLVQLVLARHLSAGELGVYFTATSLVVIGGVLAAHGYPSIATRFVSRYRRPGAAALLRAFVRRAQHETLILSAVITAIVILATAAWPDLEAQTRLSLLVAAIIIPFGAGFRLYGSLAGATRRFWVAYLPDVCLKPVVMLAGLGLLFLTVRDITLLSSMLTLTAATIVLSVAQYLGLARSFPVRLAMWRRPEAAARRGAAPVARKWRREAHAVLLVALFSQFFADLTILAATPVLPAAEMGAFGICLKLAFLLGFFVSMSQTIIMPDMADALGRGGGRNAAAKSSAACSAATFVTVSAALFCVIWGEMVLRLFGDEFAAAQEALVVLVASQVVLAAFGPANSVLTLVGQRRINLVITALSALVLAVSTALLGILFGLDGAAWAVFSTTLFWTLASAVALRRTAGIRVDLFAAWTKAATRESPDPAA